MAYREITTHGPSSQWRRSMHPCPTMPAARRYRILLLLAMMMFASISTSARAAESLHGVASLTTGEIAHLAAIYQAGKQSDEGKVADKIVRDADKAMEHGPNPAAKITTSGEAA